MAVELVGRAQQSDQVLGHDPDNSKPIYLKTGRFGPYVQLGDPEVTEKGKTKRGGKPKMASLWPSMSMETMDLEQAMVLLSFPKELGAHPDTGESITVQDGRFGPYVKCGEETRSLANHEQLASITLPEAVELLKQPKRGRRAAGQQVLAEVGKHPTSGESMVVKNGRFGPYVTDGVINASLPKGKDPALLTYEEALTLLNTREQKLRDEGKDPRAKAAKKTNSNKASSGDKATKRRSSRAKATAK
jgi:DNA topoisomerase-1